MTLGRDYVGVRDRGSRSGKWLWLIMLILAALGLLAVGSAVDTVQSARLSLRSNQTCPSVVGLNSDLVDRLSRKRFIIVGEKHGTFEYPEFFYGLVCELSSSRAVVVSLEFDETSTPVLQRYVESSGSKDDRDLLLASPIWNTRYVDGRSSVAILELIDKLRLLRRAGRKITVVASQPSDATLSDQYYDELDRANKWALTAAKYADHINVVLVGTAHAALSDNDGLGFLPAAAHLRSTDIASFGPRPEGGMGWNLDVSPSGEPSMGPHPLPGGSVTKAGISRMRDRTSGFDYLYSLGHPATPAPPAGSPR